MVHRGGPLGWPFRHCPGLVVYLARDQAANTSSSTSRRFAAIATSDRVGFRRPCSQGLQSATRDAKNTGQLVLRESRTQASPENRRHLDVMHPVRGLHTALDLARRSV